MQIDQQNTLIHQYNWAFIPPPDCKHPLLLGGFGCGKTHAIGLRWLYLIDWRAKHQKFKTKLMIVEPTYQLIRDVLVPELNDFFDSFKIKHHYHKSVHNYTIWLNGIAFTAMLRSADNPASLTGKTLTDVIIDEFDKIKSISDQRAVWTELIARIRKVDHSTLGAVTTPEGFKYTYELWQEKHSDNPNFRLVRAKTRDNHFLPADYIDNLVAQYDSLLAKQYLEGEFVNLNNMAAYYAFLRDKNVKPLPPVQPGRVLIGIDFNVNPMTAAVCQQAENNILVKSEYYIRNSNTAQLCQAIRGDYPDHEIIACPDMTGKNRKTSADITDLQILQRYGFQILGFNKNITERGRLNIVNNMLDKKRLLVDPSCVHVIKDLEQVTTNEQGFIPKKADDPLTHISTCWM